MDVSEVTAMLKAHGVNVNRVKAWTMCYFPFTMGGSVWRPGWAWVDAEDPIDIGKGMLVQLIHGPEGEERVICAISGGIIGPNLDAVAEDVAACDDVPLMRKQVQDAKAKFERGGATEMPTEELWRRLANAAKKAAAG